jgi:hypothetical protein
MQSRVQGLNSAIELLCCSIPHILRLPFTVPLSDNQFLLSLSLFSVFYPPFT